jgi:non-ribosomal peptide synthetase component F
VWAWLTAFAATQLGRQDFEWLPLVDIRACAPLAPGEPLFETALVFENYPLDPAGWRWGARTHASDLRYIGGRANHPLTLFIFPGAALEFRAVYDARRLPADRVAAMLAHLAHLLTTLATADDLAIDAWSPLDDAARRRLIGSFPALDGARPTGVPARFAAIATAHPEAPAAVSAAGTLTYRQLQRRARQLAALLKEHQP